MQQVTKIKIGINQKINLGNYETRDYHLGLDIEGFNPESIKEVQDAINFGRELCLDETAQYYKIAKGELYETDALDKKAKKEYVDLEDKINSAINEKQLRILQSKVEKIKEIEMKKVMLKKFNIKLISLKNDKH